MSPRSNRVLAALVIAVLWTAGMLRWASTIDGQTIVTAIVAGVVAGALMYWLFDKFSGRFRG